MARQYEVRSKVFNSVLSPNETLHVALHNLDNMQISYMSLQKGQWTVISFVYLKPIFFYEGDITQYFNAGDVVDIEYYFGDSVHTPEHFIAMIRHSNMKKKQH